MRPLPWLIAHRGANANAPENTAAAFDLAFSCGVDGVETDIQLSADGVPVIFHDDSLRRVAARGGAVADHPLSALQGMDFGAWFSEDFRRAPILTLEMFLERYAGWGVLMLELKAGAGEQDPALYRGRLCRAVVESIYRVLPVSLHGQVFILSFDAGMLAQTRDLAPRFKYVLNIKSAPSRRISDPALLRDLWGFGLPYRKLDFASARHCHDQGKYLAVYSCNTPAEVDNALRIGADVVMTDDPESISGHFAKAHKKTAAISDISEGE